MTIAFIILSLVSIVFSVKHDLMFKGDHCFQRSGGIITSLGTFLLIWNIVKNGVVKTAENIHTTDGGTFDSKNPEDEFTETISEESKNIIAVYIGTILIILGTLISSFGDLI